MSDKKPEGDFFTLNKRSLKFFLSIIAFAIILFWAITNYQTLWHAFLWLVGLFEPFIAGLCIAFVINTLLTPLEKLWAKIFRKAKKPRQGLKRAVCLVLSVLIVFGLVFAVLFMLIPEIKKTTTSFVNMLPTYMTELGSWWDSARSFLDDYNINLPAFSTGSIDWNSFAKTVKDYLFSNSNTLIGSTVNITAGIFSSVFNIVLSFAFSIYILAQKETLGRQIRSLISAILPQKAFTKINDFCSLTYASFSKFVTGQCIEAVIIGFLCFIGMLIFQMPFASVISVLVGFTALVPIFGAFIGTAIGAFLILLVDPLTAIWFVLYIIVLQQFEGNVIYPKVVGKSVGLPGIWVILAVTVGGNAFGLPGMLCAVPLSSVVYTLLKQFVVKRRAQQNITNTDN